MKAWNPNHRISRDFPSPNSYTQISNGPSNQPGHLSHFSEILLCWCPNSSKWLSLFTSSPISKPRQTCQPLAFHTLLLVDNPASHSSDRTEATHIKSSPPGHRNRARVSPWPTLPSFPFITGMKGLAAGNSSVSTRGLQLSPLTIPVFSWSSVSPSLLDHPLYCTDCPGNLSSTNNSLWTLHNPPSTTSFQTPFYSSYLSDGSRTLKLFHNNCGFGGGLVTESYLTLATPWTVACQAPLSMGFSRQVYWSGWPFPSPEDFPNPGIKPGSPALQAESLQTEL